MFVFDRDAACLDSFVVKVISRDRRDLLSVFVWQPILVYAYLCAPRVALVLHMPSSELRLNRGFFDQTLAYVGLLLGVFHLVNALVPAAPRKLLIRILVIWIHVDFLLRCIEAALMYQFDIGYSSLFFYHLGWQSLRLAFSQYWLLIAPVLVAIAATDWVLRRMVNRAIPWPGMNNAARIATVVMLLFGVRCLFVLHRERRRAPEDFAFAALATNWETYLNERRGFERVRLSATEAAYMRTLGIGLRRLTRPPIQTRRPEQPLNLITVYLEGFQANFTEAGHGPYEGLTPNLDRFASQYLFMSSFYNAVTPTINSLISSQCGILSQVENDALDSDRGYTRNLVCLSDVLHDAGYHQEFLGGADSGFSGKLLFLKAHKFDDVWGWERWEQNEVYSQEGRRNAWGLNDTDLVREAVRRLPLLAAHPPFHLSLLTVNTHEPGYPAADCPEYKSGRLMLNAIHCTDHAMGLLMTALEEGGYLQNTAVILMGDHMMFPTPESALALGPAAADWFGKVFMAAYWPSGPRPGRIDRAAYTPDFAPIALDLLGFKPLPRFAFGRSPISAVDPRRTLVADHFQILNGKMFPAHPKLDTECSEELLERTTIQTSTGVISACAREKIIATVEERLQSASPRTRGGSD